MSLYWLISLLQTWKVWDTDIGKGDMRLKRLSGLKVYHLASHFGSSPLILLLYLEHFVQFSSRCCVGCPMSSWQVKGSCAQWSNTLSLKTTHSHMHRERYVQMITSASRGKESACLLSLRLYQSKTSLFIYCRLRRQKMHVRTAVVDNFEWKYLCRLSEKQNYP